jgi:hypothetical protein
MATKTGGGPNKLLIIGGIAALAVVAFVAIGLVFMSGNRAASQKLLCGVQLKQLGLAMMMSGDSEPDDLTGFVDTENIDRTLLVCPSDDDVTATPGPLVLGENLSYEFLGSAAAAGPGAVIARCRPENHDDGTNHLYRDGSVRFE